MGLTGYTDTTATVAGNATLSNFTQSGGTLTGAGTLTVAGLTTWTGGYESGAGITNANGGLTIGGSDNAYHSEYLDGRTLNNQGAATLAVNPNYGGALTSRTAPHSTTRLAPASPSSPTPPSLTITARPTAVHLHQRWHPRQNEGHQYQCPWLRYHAQ